MRLLVTGGAGFIGSHLCDLLLAEGHAVEALDDLSTGSRANVAHLDGAPGFHLSVGSVADEDLLDRLLERCDAVVHLAAAVGVRRVVDNPVRAIETNVRGTEVVLAHAHRRVRRVLVASTSEVYGKSEALPFREDADLQLGPTYKSRWAYACSKAIDEFLAMAYWREHGLPVVVARLFNTVGPRQTGRYGMVLPRLVAQALAADPLSVYGDGTQRRCFCHVEDVTRGLLGLLDCERANGEVFNIGSSEETTILDLARRIIAITGSASEIVLVPYEEVYGEGFEDTFRRVPDTSKLRALIGWRPTRSLEQIIEQVVDDRRGKPPDIADTPVPAVPDAADGPSARDRVP